MLSALVYPSALFVLQSSLPRMKIASTFECKWLQGPHYRAEKCDAHRTPDV